jgi:hypothetical protein
MARIPAGQLADTAHALMRAGQWALAARLLDAAAPAGETERAVLALAAAEVAVDQDFWCGTSRGGSSLSRASDAVANAAAADPADDQPPAWDLDLLRLRHAYYRELSGPEGPSFGPEGRDAGLIEDLAARAARLRASAPDGARRAAAAFLAGLVADNLRGDAAAARELFAEALTTAEKETDDETASEALRHLGYHDAEAGNAGLARERWLRSADLRQRAGAVPYVLAQFLLLGGLDRDGGDLARARVLATEVRRWAHALGIGILEKQSVSLADSAGQR